jgi:hypothetical protein
VSRSHELQVVVEKRANDVLESSSRQYNIPLSTTVPPVPTVLDYATQATQWLQHCLEDHDGHCPPVHHVLPTRVIDVAKSTHRIRLYEPQPGERARYAALSYCWGLSRTFITTIATLDQRISGFTLDDLLATIRDAVLLARDMSIPYLWVDSLCIIQDSKADWEREAAQMCAIYTDATIAFAAIDCPDSEIGLIIAGDRRLVEVGSVEERIFARKHHHGRVGRLYQDTTKVLDRLKNNVLLSRGW